MKALPLLLTSTLLALAAFTATAGANSSTGPTSYPTGSRDSLTIRSGESGGNGDVHVTNSSNQVGSSASATITPKEADGPTNSTVRTKKNFSGTIQGLEGGDTADLGSDNGDSANFQTLVYGTGGTVNIGNDSFVTVTNLGAAGGPDITVWPISPAVWFVPW